MMDKNWEEAHQNQTHCFTCGKKLEHIKFQCPICGEWSCSDECRQKHIEIMERI